MLPSIRVVLSACLRLLTFLPAVLIPACASFSPAFLMMYSAYKLNKQGDNIQPWCTPFSIWSQSVVPCPVLTIASWPAYRFLKRQVRWSGIPISFIYPWIKVPLWEMWESARRLKKRCCRRIKRDPLRKQIYTQMTGPIDWSHSYRPRNNPDCIRIQLHSFLTLVLSATPYA